MNTASRFILTIVLFLGIVFLCPTVEASFLSSSPCQDGSMAMMDCHESETNHVGDVSSMSRGVASVFTFVLFASLPFILFRTALSFATQKYFQELKRSLSYYRTMVKPKRERGFLRWLVWSGDFVI